MKPVKFQLSKNDTDILKGIALLLLLAHHLFYVRTGLYNDIEVLEGRYLINQLGIACKICVPLFVFLSGYGLMASAEKFEQLDCKKFFVHRFSKLFLNYWFIWLLFVPIGIIYYGRTFVSVYGDNYFLSLMADFFGVYNIGGGVRL